MRETVMQELLEWVRKSFHRNLDIPRIMKSKIESLILLKKEQIIEAHKAGRNDRHNDFGREGEGYYNETFKQHEI